MLVCFCSGAASSRDSFLLVSNQKRPCAHRSGLRARAFAKVFPSESATNTFAPHCAHVCPLLSSTPSQSRSLRPSPSQPRQAVRDAYSRQASTGLLNGFLADTNDFCTAKQSAARAPGRKARASWARWGDKGWSEFEGATLHPWEHLALGV